MSLVPSNLRRLGGSLRSLVLRPLHLGQFSAPGQAVRPSPHAAKTCDQALARKLATMSPQRRHRMRGQLSQLLRRHPRARLIFRHLAAVEHSLRAADPLAFAALPPSVLGAAHEQLQTLVTDWSALGLHDLRATLQHSQARAE